MRNLLFILMATTLCFAGCSADDPADAGDAGSFPIDASADDPDAAEDVVCNFTTCDGCCDGNTCIDPTSTSACGQSGSACQSCSAGDTCAAGSCVTPTANCDACTDTGCCLDGTQCLEGNTVAACGADGDACVGCPDGQGCVAGECVATVCDNTNCEDGCCTANGDCITYDGQDIGACGDQGAACDVCSNDALSCTLGTCVEDQPCLDFCTDGCCNSSGQCILFAEQDPDVCGAAETCSGCTGDLSCIEGTCTADPVWQVIVDSAIIDPTDDEGGEWDQTLFSNPLPDPYVSGSLIGDTLPDWLTETIDNTLTPNWDEPQDSYLQSDLIGTGLLINVRDSDGVAGFPFELIAACNVTITIDDLNAGTLTKATCGAKVTNLVLDFVQQ